MSLCIMLLVMCAQNYAAFARMLAAMTRFSPHYLGAKALAANGFPPDRLLQQTFASARILQLPARKRATPVRTIRPGLRLEGIASFKI